MLRRAASQQKVLQHAQLTFASQQSLSFWDLAPVIRGNVRPCFIVALPLASSSSGFGLAPPARGTNPETHTRQPRLPPPPQTSLKMVRAPATLASTLACGGGCAFVRSASFEGTQRACSVCRPDRLAQQINDQDALFSRHFLCCIYLSIFICTLRLNVTELSYNKKYIYI